MKNLFKSILTVLCGALLLSCDFEPYQINLLSDSISVSSQEITLESTGSVPVTFDVQAVGDWIIVAPEGLSVSPRCRNHHRVRSGQCGRGLA